MLASIMLKQIKITLSLMVITVLLFVSIYHHEEDAVITKHNPPTKYQTLPPSPAPTRTAIPTAVPSVWKPIHHKRRKPRGPKYYFKSVQVSTGAYTGWFQYRLADMFKDKQFRKKPIGFRHIKLNFNTSIAYDYMTRVDDNANYTVLETIIDERTAEALKPSNRTLVMHWRTGDVIDNAKITIVNRTIDDFVSNYGTEPYQWYVKPFKYYAKILNDTKPYNLTHITVVTGWHSKHEHTRSVQYIDTMIGLLQKLNYNVSLRINRNPDDDLVFMCNSKYFVRGGGGFSDIIAHIVKRKGGYVFP
eukprot:494640_1